MQTSSTIVIGKCDADNRNRLTFGLRILIIYMREGILFFVRISTLINVVKTSRELR